LRPRTRSWPARRLAKPSASAAEADPPTTEASHAALEAVEGETAPEAAEGELPSKVAALVAELGRIRLEAPEVKSVVFSQFVGFLDVCERALRAAGFETCRIDGSMSVKARCASTAAFNLEQGGPAVILISLRAGGTGLNLTRASQCFLMDMCARQARTACHAPAPRLRVRACFVHAARAQPRWRDGSPCPRALRRARRADFSPSRRLAASAPARSARRWWNAAVDQQAVERIHRIGQRREVRVVKYVSAGTIEEKVALLQEYKAELSQGVLSFKPEDVQQVRLNALVRLLE
jgi:hypothetical protein